MQQEARHGASLANRNPAASRRCGVALWYFWSKALNEQLPLPATRPTRHNCRVDERTNCRPGPALCRPSCAMTKHGVGNTTGTAQPRFCATSAPRGSSRVANHHQLRPALAFASCALSAAASGCRLPSAVALSAFLRVRAAPRASSSSSHRSSSSRPTCNFAIAAADAVTFLPIASNDSSASASCRSRPLSVFCSALSVSRSSAAFISRAVSCAKAPETASTASGAALSTELCSCRFSRRTLTLRSASESSFTAYLPESSTKLAMIPRCPFSCLPASDSRPYIVTRTPASSLGSPSWTTELVGALPSASLASRAARRSSFRRSISDMI
mmetsp:Transcript_37286/g.82006  ORF Transcript_37286/g.82006 Transcript_37286/m.82006 type:complete len:328 (+) Transcript_37286:134-1117(+)